MKKYFKFIISLIICLNLTATVNAEITKVDIDKETIQQIDRLQKVKEKGSLTVLSADMQPYSYKDPKVSAFRGIDADIIREISNRLGIKEVNVKYITFPYMIEELIKNPEIDLIGQSLYLTEERQKIINFTEPLYTGTEAILTRTDSNINSKSDLNGKTIGILSGSAYHNISDVWRNQGLIKDYTTFYDNPSLIIALKNKIVDAIITDSIIAENILLKERDSNLKILSPGQYNPTSNFNSAYSFKKDDITLLNAFNEKIKEMKEDGTLYRILAQYGATSHYIQ